MNKRAFSLLEVIIVMAIISLLATLLAPGFSAARQRAKDVVCMSNIKQLGLAVELYRADYEEYPMSGPLLDSYLGNAKLVDPQLGSIVWNFSAYVNNSMMMRPEVVKEGEWDRAAAFFDCRAKRGPDYPLVLDVNHLPRILRIDDELPGFVLLYRVSGATNRVSKSRFAAIQQFNFVGYPKLDLPCDPRLTFSNL